MIGQSNAALFTGNGYLNLLAQDIEHDLGFNGTNQVVNVIVQPGPPGSGSTNISSAPATEFGGTGLTTDWLTPINGNEADGWTSGTNEDGVYSQMNALLTFLAQTVASNPALRGEPTVILDLHNESDSQNPDLSTAIWMSALQFEASSIRAVLGDTPSQAPYAFVNAIPFPEEPIATASQAQVDENEQSIRLGMESLASNPEFNAIIAAQISDVDQNYQANDYGGWHLSANSTINSAGQVIALATNPQTGAAYDDYVLEQRLALALADQFSASALPGSNVANAMAATSSLLDDTGPLVTGAATATGSPNELLLTVKQFDSMIGFNTKLSADAQAGVGWSIRTSATGVSSELVASATSATIISATQILLTFDAPVPAASSGDLLFYAWGGERISQAGTPSSALSSDYNGTAYPGEGAAIYDSEGEPIYTNAAGVIIGSSQQTIANHLTVVLGQTLTAPIITSGTLELAEGSSITGNISFSGTGGELIIDGTAPGNIINGFTFGDTIELAGIPFSGTSAIYGATGKDTYTVASVGTLSVDAEGTVYNVLIAGAEVGQTNFVLSDDLAITEAACFAAGTRILTANGALVAVEDLRIGDRVKLLSGASAPVRWIGRRALDLRRHPRPEAVQPILVSASALSHGVPWRDLVVSPDHAFYLEGCLIPAKALINGFSIRQLNRTGVTYYHIELPEHAVMVAEGAAVESYLDTGNRAAFENGGPAVLLHPDFAQGLREIGTCAPFAESGPAVEAVRQRILDRAGIETIGDPDLRITYENGAAFITSRSAIPGEIFADPRDRRRLGVKIKELRAGQRIIPLDHQALIRGWHDPEPDGRWTDGCAVIPQRLLASGNLHLALTATIRNPICKQVLHQSVVDFSPAGN